MIKNYDSVVARPYTATPHSQKQESKSYISSRRTWLSWVTILVTLFSFFFVQGQIGVTVSGNTNTTPNLSATYASFSSFVSELNGVTAVSGPVTVTLAAGASETAPVKGFNISTSTANVFTPTIRLPL